MIQSGAVLMLCCELNLGQERNSSAVDVRYALSAAVRALMLFARSSNLPCQPPTKDGVSSMCDHPAAASANWPCEY